jgi:hypothetical protein
MPFEWQRARVETLEALGRAAEAQTYRWTCFEQSLHGEHLKAFLKRLPDFDDIEAEEKAFVHARAFPDVHQALAFFLNWPTPAEASFAPHIDDFGNTRSHDLYVAELKRRHGKKHGFWSLVT